LTKKDYEAFAEIIKDPWASIRYKEIKIEEVIEILIADFCKLFSYDNTNFDENKFRQACKPDNFIVIGE